MKYNTLWTDDEENENEMKDERERERTLAGSRITSNFFIGNSITFSTSDHTGPLTRVHYKKKRLLILQGL